MQIIRQELNEAGVIPVTILESIIEKFEREYQPVYAEQETYIKAKNAYIISRRKGGSTYIPNWIIPVPYGRKIITTITGYMYKPGAITYIWQNPDDGMQAIFDSNRETVKNKHMGTYQAVNGLCFEYHYIGKDDSGEPIPKFSVVKAASGIPIYDSTIEPELNAFIRIYVKDDVNHYEVSYKDTIVTYKRIKQKSNQKDFLQLISTINNVYGAVPAIVCRNNFDMDSDIEIIKSLLDAYDVLFSDSMKEFDSFAWAYLLIAGASFKREEWEKIQKNRVFQNLEELDKVGFLTKDINTEFMQFLAEILKKEIHDQSFVPDIANLNIGGMASGVAVDRFTHIMEYIAADKEAEFRETLERRIAMIQRIRSNIGTYDSIVFERNLPSKDQYNADIYTKLDGRGISRTTLMDKYMPWIDNPEEELAKYEEEQKQEASSLDIPLPGEPVPQNQMLDENGNIIQMDNNGNII